MKQIILDRRALHRIPELELYLPKTMEYLASSLSALNCRVFSPMESSLCAFFDFGAGSTIAFRADCDGLPMEENTGLDFASCHPGRMHACGHDGHMAIALELARRLSAKKTLRYNVLLVFQPAEETTGGAKDICKTGIFTKYNVQAIFGMHLWPGLEAGYIFSRKNEMMSRSCEVTVDIYGRSAHIAKAEEGVDALAMAVRIYNALQLIKTREISPFEPVIINVGQIVGGTANNIVAESAYMNLSLRTLSNDVDAFLVRRITEIAEGTAKEMGGSAKVETYKYCPCLVNDARLVDAVIAASEKVVDKDKINPNKPVAMGAEDFAYYTLHKPGLMFNLGVKEYDGTFGALHNGKMTVNEDVLDIPAKIFVEFVLDQMEG